MVGGVPSRREAVGGCEATTTVCLKYIASFEESSRGIERQGKARSSGLLSVGNVKVVVEGSTFGRMVLGDGRRTSRAMVNARKSKDILPWGKDRREDIRE